ncbi:MAG: cysteine peptidase family C39 domain-containing protein [Chloroflexota bacterium]
MTMNPLPPARIDIARTSVPLSTLSRGRYANHSWQSSPTFNTTLDRVIRRQSQIGSSTNRVESAMRRVDQGSVSEYDNVAQARLWGGSTCSAASLTAVLRSRGINVRIADVMKAMPGALTPELGLISRQGLVQAAEKFGLRAQDDVRTMDDLRRTTATGAPVMVDVRSARFPEGHWLVVKKVTAAAVEVVDSSGYRMTSIPADQFLREWSGKGIRVNGV